MSDDFENRETSGPEVDSPEAMMEDMFWAQLATRLKKAREQTSMSQETLARRVGLSGPAIANYESGARKPSVYQLDLLANALVKPINYFVGYSGTVPPPAFKREFLSLMRRLTEATYLDNTMGTVRDGDYCIPVPPDIAGDQTQYYRYTDPETGLVTYYVLDKQGKARPGDLVLAVDTHSKKVEFYMATMPALRHPEDDIFGIVTAELRRLKK